MGFLYEVLCVNSDKEEWIDSYWLDREEAKEEFENIVSFASDNLPIDEEDEFFSPILKIQLFKRFLNKTGNGCPYWRDGEECIYTAVLNKRKTEYEIREGL